MGPRARPAAAPLVGQTGQVDRAPAQLLAPATGESAPPPQVLPTRPRPEELPLRLAGAVLAGMLLYLAFPPVDLPWLAPVGVAVLALVCRRQSARRGALLGLTTGLALFLPLVEWTATIAGPPALVALALLQAAFLALLGALLPGRPAAARLAAVDGGPVGAVRGAALADAVRRLPVGAARLQPGRQRADAAGRAGRRAAR